MVKHAKTINTDLGETPKALLEVCRHITNSAGRAWLVGGCVRDLLLGIQPKDYDLEVYGIEPEHLDNMLAPLGKTEHVGKRFGVTKLWLNGLEVDIALPRSETKTASGHSGFSINSDPWLKPETAVLRRDFTINAMMFDPIDQTLLDFHGGRDDLANKILRHVSPAFAEDPLRPLRAMQFAARFQLRLDKETAGLCRLLLSEATALPKARIWKEWQKWSHAAFPSFGLQLLRDSGWLGYFPAAEALIDCPQPPRWHPEGDVWTHTLQVCDQAARIARQSRLDHATTERLLFAAFCHDFGKPACTISDASGNICSPGHSEQGVEPAEQFLYAIGAPGRLLEHIRPLILEHITHLHGKPTPRAVRRLAHRLEPVNIELWEMLVESDACGRSPAPLSRPALAWLKQAKLLVASQNKPKPVVTGAILLEMGVSPGPEMGHLIKHAYEAQLDGDIHDEASARDWCITQLNRL